MNIAKYLSTFILKYICEQLLLQVNVLVLVIMIVIVYITAQK